MLQPVQRIPDAVQSLGCMLQAGVEIGSILDIGVLKGTPVLQQVFPRLRHHLFEPLDTHIAEIRTNYRGFDFHLHQVALSDLDGQAWQVGVDMLGGGEVTHSTLQLQPATPGTLNKQGHPVIHCAPVHMARLDSLIDRLDAPTPYLVKVDVDGHELPILRGAERTLQQANVVMIEATTRALVERVALLDAMGFALFDIVDLAYYGGTLAQVDLLFVRKELVPRHPALCPWQFGAFRPEWWYPYPTVPAVAPARVHRIEVN